MSEDVVETTNAETPQAEQPNDLPKAGEIRGMAVLDLTGMKTEEELAGITSIRDVALVLVPEALSHKLMTIPMSDVATVVPVPSGARVRMFTGQINLPGEALSNEGGQEDIIVATGQLVVTSPVQKAGAQLYVTGQLLAPKGSEAAVGAAAVRIMGQTVYYSGIPRCYNGDQSFPKEYFEFFDDKITFVLNGNFTIEPGVTLQLLKEKVAEIVLNGVIAAPRELVPALLALTSELNGEIQSLEDKAAAEAAKAASKAADPSAPIISNA